jgi:hypothetical protein
MNGEPGLVVVRGADPEIALDGSLDEDQRARLLAINAPRKRRDSLGLRAADSRALF